MEAMPMNHEVGQGEQPARLRIWGEPGTRICMHGGRWIETDWVIPPIVGLAEGYLNVNLLPGPYSFAGHVYDGHLTRYTHVTAGLVEIDLDWEDDVEITLRPLTVSWAPGHIRVLAVRGGDPGTGIETWWYEEWEGEWTWFYKDTADDEGLVAWEECFWDEENGCGCWARFLSEPIFPIIAVSEHVVLPSDSSVVCRADQHPVHPDDAVEFVQHRPGHCVSAAPLPRWHMTEKYPWWERDDHVAEWLLVERDGAVMERFQMPTHAQFVVGGKAVSRGRE